MLYEAPIGLQPILDNAIYKDDTSATPSISDPELRQSDISTSQIDSDTRVPSASLVKSMNDGLTDLNAPTLSSGIAVMESSTQVGTIYKLKLAPKWAALYFLGNSNVSSGNTTLNLGSGYTALGSDSTQYYGAALSGSGRMYINQNQNILNVYTASAYGMGMLIYPTR